MSDDKRVRAISAAFHIRQLQSGIEERQLTQAWIAARVARDKLYEHFPGSRANKGLRQYLIHACGIEGSKASRLSIYAELVIPYCRQNNIEIKPIAEQHFNRLTEVLAALRRAIKADDLPRVKQILQDIQEAPSRAWLRVKYQNCRQPLGTGYTVDTEDEMVIVIRMAPGVTRETLLGKMARLVQFSERPVPEYWTVQDIVERCGM